MLFAVRCWAAYSDGCSAGYIFIYPPKYRGSLACVGYVLLFTIKNSVNKQKPSA